MGTDKYPTGTSYTVSPTYPRTTEGYVVLSFLGLVCHLLSIRLSHSTTVVRRPSTSIPTVSPPVLLHFVSYSWRRKCRPLWNPRHFYSHLCKRSQVVVLHFTTKELFKSILNHSSLYLNHFSKVKIVSCTRKGWNTVEVPSLSNTLSSFVMKLSTIFLL